MTTQQRVPGALGKAPPTRDPRTVSLSSILQGNYRPPSERSWFRASAQWGALGNDYAGDCGPAGYAHQVQAWVLARDGAVPYIQVPDVLAVYSALSGYNPATGANDTGVVVLDMLNYLRKQGLAGHVLGAFASVPYADIQMVATAIALFGGLGLGLALPLTARDQFIAGQPWSIQAGPGSTPGSWGLHYVTVLEYSPLGLRCISWGYPVELTWQFLATYADEAYALLSPDWVDGSGTAPSGLNQQALQQALTRITADEEPTVGEQLTFTDDQIATAQGVVAIMRKYRAQIPGFNVPDLAALGVTYWESGGWNPQAMNSADPNGGSAGPFQINGVHQPGFAVATNPWYDYAFPEIYANWKGQWTADRAARWADVAQRPAVLAEFSQAAQVSDAWPAGAGESSYAAALAMWELLG